MIRVAPLAPGGEAAWDAFAATHPNGTFFHRAAWGTLLHQVFGHTQHSLVAEQDGAIVGVLPLSRVKTILFGDSLISAPFAVYGGPLAANADAAAALEAAAEALMHRLSVPVMEWRFRDPPPPLDPAWLAKDDLYVTFRKPITANDDANLKSIPRKQRAMVRKGIDKALSSTVDPNVDTLYRIYAESVRNLGTPVFPKRWFNALAKTFAADMDIVVVRDGSTTVSAVMNFYDRRPEGTEVLPYYGGGTAAARQVAGHDFLYWEVMRRAAAMGCIAFDFGRSKAGTGSFSFKKNWGFQPAPLLHRFRLAPGQSIPDHNPLNPKYRLMIATWKRLPLPVANLIGPFVVRGVG